MSNPFTEELNRLKQSNPFADELAELSGETTEVGPSGPLDKEKKKRFPGSNLLRGAATGIAAEGVLGTTDLVASVAQLGAKLIPGGEEAVKGFRGRIRESQDIIAETLDAEGTAGTVGRVAGALGGLMIGGGSKAAVTGVKSIFGGGVYGAVAVKAIGQMAKMDNAIGTAAKIGINGTFIQRAVINALAGAPIDFLQAHTLPESEAVLIARHKQEKGIELTDEDEDALDEHYSNQLKVLGFGLAAGGLGGAAFEGLVRRIKPVDDAASRIRAQAPDAASAEAEIKSTSDALMDLSKIAMRRKAARKAAATAWNSSPIATKKKLIEGLTDDQYALPYGDLESHDKQFLSEVFGGPKIGPDLPKKKTAAGVETSPEATVAEAAPVTTSPPEAPRVERRGPDRLSDEEYRKITGETRAQQAARIAADKTRTIPPKTPEQLAAETAERERALEEYRKKHGIVPVDPEVEVEIEKLSKVNPELAARAKAEGWTKEKLLEELLVDTQKGLEDPKIKEAQEAVARFAKSSLGDIPEEIVNKALTIRSIRATATDAATQAKMTGEYGHLLVDLTPEQRDRLADFIFINESAQRDIAALRTQKGTELVDQAIRGDLNDLNIELPPDHKLKIVNGKRFVVTPSGQLMPEKEFNAFWREQQTHKVDDGPPAVIAQQAETALTQPKFQEGQLVQGLPPGPHIKVGDIDVEFPDELHLKLFMEADRTRNLPGVDSPVEAALIGRAYRDHVLEVSKMTGGVNLRAPQFKHVMEGLGKVNKAAQAKAPKLRTLEEIDKEIDEIDDAIDAGTITDAEAEVKIKALAKEKSKLKPKAEAKPTPSKMKPTATMGKDLKDFNKDQLMLTKRTIRSLLNNVQPGSADEATLKAEMARIMEFEAKQGGGLDGVVQMHPSITGGVGGFFAGYLFGDEEDRLRNAVMFGAVGLGGGIYAARRWGAGVPRARPKLTPWEEEVAKKVVSHDDIEKTRTPFMLRLRQAESFFVSRSTAAVQTTKALGGAQLPTQRNFGRLFQMFGRWQSRVESALIDGPSIVDDAGNVVWLDAMPVQKIAAMVKGDSDRLGLLMAAGRALELGAKGIKTGIDMVSARMTFNRSGPEYHAAAAEMRKFNAALLDIADRAGLLFDRDKMRDVFYAPLNRVFGHKVGGGSATQNVTGPGKKPIGGSQPFKHQTGGEQLILNPFEATVDNLPRILKAAELNELGRAFVEMLDVADPTIAKHFGKRLHGPEKVKIEGYEDKIFQLKKEVAALGGKLSDEDAAIIAHTYSDEALTLQNDVLRVWNKGRIEQIRVNPELAKAFRSLQPEELSGLLKFIGLPTKLARLGIVNDPFFIFRQAFRDNWQAWLNTEYGFIPGISQANGWFNIVTRSKAYKEYLAGGGGYGSFAEQRFAKGVTALPDVQRAPVRNSLDQAAQEIRELHPLKAYQTLITPVVEAARVGEYLRARGAGASVIDGVYAAKHVTGNYQDIGTGMRAAGMLTLFLNPAIKSLAQSARSFRRDPVGYMTKAFVGIALPSWYFWNTYQNDQELNDLRQTETGRRFWWVRSPEGIVKIPKPIFDGQVFGSTVETVLDRWKLQDEETANLTSKAVMNDIAVNLLPQIGVVPYSIFANKDLSSGFPIIPERVEGMAPQYQSGPNTSGMARVVGKEIGVAPSQIDFAVRNTFGQLGNAAVRIISLAAEYQETGYVPPKEELPGLESLFARYPSGNVGPIREFYRNAGKVDKLAKTIGYAAQYDAENVESLINSDPETASQIELYKEARDRLAELRSGVEEIRLAPASWIPPQDKKTYIDQLTKMMIETARGVNEAAKLVRQSFTGIQK